MKNWNFCDIGKKNEMNVLMNIRILKFDEDVIVLKIDEITSDF